jgi:Zn-finger nucleic acid-binding protein
MVCPTCSTPLATRRIADVDARVCRAGHGLVMPQHDLRRAIFGSSEQQPGTPSVPAGALRKASRPKHAHRPCPSCRAAMESYNYGYNSNIMLDRCDDCSLIWLDQGELRQLASYLAGDPRTDRLGTALAMLLRDFDRSDEYDLGIARWAMVFARGPVGLVFYFVTQSLLRHTGGPARFAAEVVLIILLIALLLAATLFEE